MAEHEQQDAKKPDGILQIDNWSTWHDEYQNEDSELNGRKRAVQTQVAAIAAQSPPGPVTVISICGGQALEVLGALENHPRRADVRGRIVELDEENAAFARAWTKKAGLDNLEVLTGDASLTNSYAGIPPADIVVVSGVFGHLNEADRTRLIGFLPQLLRKGGAAVWTFTPFSDGKCQEEYARIRALFQAQKLDEQSVDRTAGRYSFAITRSHFNGQQAPFEPNTKIFDFGSSRADREAAAT
jgi:hypothetical protein